MTKLSVNLNKIALLRNQRNIGIPSVTESAKTVIKAGAYGITIHPRPDERHIRYSDVQVLSEFVKTYCGQVEFNIEGNPFTGKYMDIVSDVKPNQATLVPDDPNQSTSDHGWDLQKNKERLMPLIKQLKDLGIRVSLFMDAESGDLNIAKEIGADRIELYTEPYATAFRTNTKLDETILTYAAAAKAANKIGLELNAGHDLNLKNLGKFLADVPGILEVSIGHALIAEALESGLYNTVKEYVKILSKT
jgi:pyridoxine 5-phosphate synthase